MILIPCGQSRLQGISIRAKGEQAMNVLDELTLKMIDFYAGDAERIQHFMKVHRFGELIAKMEGLSEDEIFLIETATIVHDIGIRIAEEKYGSCEGPLQEKEGPAYAEKMLAELNYDPKIIGRVSYLVGHHHTYTNIDGMDYQILVEADFLVNLFEEGFRINGVDKQQVKNVYERIFKTEAGKKICRTMFK